MFNMNLWQGLFSLVICLADGEMMAAINFILKNPDVLMPLIYFSAAMALGNVFIFQLQAGYGALTVTLTTTVRKLISVVLSVFMFGHNMNAMQWVAVAIVFFAKNASDKVAALIEGGKKEKKA